MTSTVASGGMRDRATVRRRQGRYGGGPKAGLYRGPPRSRPVRSLMVGGRRRRSDRGESRQGQLLLGSTHPHGERAPEMMSDGSEAGRWAGGAPFGTATATRAARDPPTARSGRRTDGNSPGAVHGDRPGRRGSGAHPEAAPWRHSRCSAQSNPGSVRPPSDRSLRWTFTSVTRRLSRGATRRPWGPVVEHARQGARRTLSTRLEDIRQGG